MREPGGVTPEGVSIPTTNTTLSLLSALFGMAVKRNYIENNPARGTQPKDTRRPDEKRREFDAPALAAIFGSPIYTADERPEGGAGEAAHWLPLLALYTGARINELCHFTPATCSRRGTQFRTYSYEQRHGQASAGSLRLDRQFIAGLPPASVGISAISWRGGGVGGRARSQSRRAGLV